MPISGEGQTNWFKKDYQYLKVAPEGMKNLTKNFSIRVISISDTLTATRESLQELCDSDSKISNDFNDIIQEIKQMREAIYNIQNQTKNSYDLCDSVNNYSKISIDFNKDIIQEIKQMREAIYNI